MTASRPRKQPGKAKPPARAKTTSSRSGDKLTIAEVCAELQISRSTFYDWRAKGTAPKCGRLPNGELRIRRAELDRWFSAREDTV